MPIIILEGIDGSGKTTLATHLKKLSPWPATVEHRGPIKTTVFDELISPLFEVGPDELFIADRWHLSELIYGPLYRGVSLIDEPVLNEIELALNHLGAVRVIVSPSLLEVSTRLRDRGETFLKPEHERLVHAAYQGFGYQLGYTHVQTSDRMTAMTILGGMASTRIES